MKRLESGNKKLLCYRSFALNLNVAVICKIRGSLQVVQSIIGHSYQKSHDSSKRLTGLRPPPLRGRPISRSVQTARYSALEATAQSHSRLSSRSCSSTPTCLSQYLPIVLRTASVSLRFFAASLPAWESPVSDICDKSPAFDQVRANKLSQSQCWHVSHWQERKSGSDLKREKT
jgi:hypothetical protein